MSKLLLLVLISLVNGYLYTKGYENNDCTGDPLFEVLINIECAIPAIDCVPMSNQKYYASSVCTTSKPTIIGAGYEIYKNNNCEGELFIGTYAKNDTCVLLEKNKSIKVQHNANTINQFICSDIDCINCKNITGMSGECITEIRLIVN